MLTSSCLAKKDKSPSVVSFTLSGAGKEIKIKCNHMHVWSLAGIRITELKVSNIFFSSLAHFVHIFQKYF